MASLPTEEEKRILDVYHNFIPKQKEKWVSNNLGNQLILKERNKHLSLLLNKEKLSQQKVLDIGCGNGNLLNFFQSQGASPKNLYGIDLDPLRIEAGKQQNPLFNLKIYNAAKTSFLDNHFDIITAFSSIFDEQILQDIAVEIERILKPQGIFIIYDMRYKSPSNPHVQPFSLKKASAIFQNLRLLDTHTLTVLPPIVRRIATPVCFLYSLLSFIPILRIHNLICFQKL